MAANPESDPVPVEDLTEAQANHIIHSHRKVRYGTACWPCRQRKVKCDNKQPCENCLKREHPQLCSYKPNRSGKQGSFSAGSNLGKKRAHSPDPEDTKPTVLQDAPLVDTGAADPWPRASEEQESVEITRYVGQNSIPALLRDQPSPMDTKDGLDIRQDMRPIFGLDNSAPFPLMSSRHLDRLTQDIFSQLPSDREVMKLFRSYKEIPHPFWGFVVDIDDLESRIMVYLEERAKKAKDKNSAARPVTASWLSILFAVLAVGSQYHDSPYHIRTRHSQKYVQISFHFLRLGNFLLRPNLDSIQSLLMVSFVLLNDMKAEASWALIGMTCRLAQSLGLHRTVSDSTASPEQAKKNYARRKLWWTCQWHDTLTSLSFDRPNMTNIAGCAIPLSPESSFPDHLSYLEAMYHLNELISQRLNPEALAGATYNDILNNCQAVESLRQRVYPQQRSKESCRTVVDRLQYFALRLHTSFVISVCCRPALRRVSPAGVSEPLSPEEEASSPGSNLTSREKRSLSDKCKLNLTETVRMFLAMHQISNIPTRSWAFTYHGLSSAVLLGIMGETKTDPEVRALQGDLIAALSAAAAKDRSQSPPGGGGGGGEDKEKNHIRRSDRDIELSGPLSRALAALKNIYDYGGLHPHQHPLSEVVSRVQTPLGLSLGGEHSGTSTSSNGNTLVGSSAGGDGPGLSGSKMGGGTLASDGGFNRHQDAALAMTEMQNGSSLNEYTAGLPFNPSPSVQQQGVALPDVNPGNNGSGGGTDPSTTMAPMDLYDSIFWESPDPFYAGADMNFDFLPQAPPGQSQEQFYF